MRAGLSSTDRILAPEVQEPVTEACHKHGSVWSATTPSIASVFLPQNLVGPLENGPANPVPTFSDDSLHAW
eukprot:1610910-Rhodomonas_salina.2